MLTKTKIAFAAALMRHLAQEVQRARAKAETLSLKTVAERVDAWTTLNDGSPPPRERWRQVASEIGVTAEALYREIIRLDEKVYGPEHPDTLVARQDLATTLQAEHKYPEAEAEYRDVIGIEQRLIGPEHPDTLTCRNNLAEVLDDEGEFAEAETECRQIIGLEEKALGPENQVTLNSRGNLAVALIGLGKFADAEVQYKEVLELMERVLGLERVVLV